jgi:phospholipid/cholesterol/gamma-HCH transport system substrate-binding protein
MKRDTINYFVVGVFVLSVFFVFLLVLYRITGSTGPVDEYYVSYSNITGIKFGTPVLYEGFQIGQVEKIDPLFVDGDTRYRLTLSVIRDWRIQADSLARIEASGLLSTVSIDIKKGRSKTLLAPGDEIPGMGSNDLFATINEVAMDIRDLSRNSLRPLLDKLNNQVDLIAADITDITSGNIKPLFRDQVFPLFNKLNDSADRLTRILSNENLENVDAIISNLQEASNEADVLMKNVQNSRWALDNLLAEATQLVVENKDDLDAAVTDLRKTLYVASQHIDAISHHLEGASRNMHEFTRQIRENPGLLLRGSAPRDEQGGPQ